MYLSRYELNITHIQYDLNVNINLSLSPYATKPNDFIYPLLIPNTKQYT